MWVGLRVIIGITVNGITTHVSKMPLTLSSAVTLCMQSGRTALHVAAARNRSSETVELLLKQKASIDLQDTVTRVWAWEGCLLVYMLVITVRDQVTTNVSDRGSD